jgi:hypothetical protein
VAFTTDQRPDTVEIDFLGAGDNEMCRQARKRVAENHDFLVSPRATAQLQREIIEKGLGGRDGCRHRSQHPGAHSAVHHVRAKQRSWVRRRRADTSGDRQVRARNAERQPGAAPRIRQEVHPRRGRLESLQHAGEVRDGAVEHLRPVVCAVGREIQDNRPRRNARRSVQDWHRRRPVRTCYDLDTASSCAAAPTIRSDSPATSWLPAASLLRRSITWSNTWHSR